MRSFITIRDIDPKDKSWLEHEALQRGVSMEKLVCLLIHEQCEKSQNHTKLSAAFQRYFGPDHGVDLPLPKRYGYRPIMPSDDGKP